MKDKPESRFQYDLDETILYQSTLFLIVRRSLRDRKTGEVRFHEMVRRPPGVRVIVRTKDDSEFLMVREFRHEYGEWDIRLPGGKVFDVISNMLVKPSLQLAAEAEKAARREIAEELGLKLDSLQAITCQRLGATIEWDLYYYTAIISRTTILADQSQDFGEELRPVWLTRAELASAIREGAFREARSIPVLLRYIKDLPLY